jgi:hypothetical protein
MLWRLKLGAKSEIENMCVAFWCLTVAGLVSTSCPTSATVYFSLRCSCPVAAKGTSVAIQIAVKSKLQSALGAMYSLLRIGVDE